MEGRGGRRAKGSRAGLLDSRAQCIETQQYRINPDGTWSLLVHVNPESPLGGTAFAIDATWTARPSGDGGTEITITVTVELKRSLWGGSGFRGPVTCFLTTASPFAGGYGNSMVEGLLEKSARTEYELWERTAQAAVATMAPPDAPSAGAAGADTVGAEGAASSADEVRLRLGPDVDAPSRQQQPPSLFNRHAIRYRVSTVGHGLVRGTERFVQAIAGAEEDLHEGGLIHVPINASNRSSLNGVSVFYHNGRYRAPRSCCQQRRRVIVLLVLLLLVAAVLGAIFWFFEELWVLLH